MKLPGKARAVVGFLSVATLVALGGAQAVEVAHPRGWGGGGEGYELSRDETQKHGGRASGSIRSIREAPLTFGSLTQGFQADQYRSQRLRMTAYVKTEGVEGWAGLWMRIDGKERDLLAFDNMASRGIKGTTDWRKHDVVLDVPDNAEEIVFGFLVSGKGRGWVDDFKFEVVGKDVATTARQIPPKKRNREIPAGPPNLDFEH